MDKKPILTVATLLYDNQLATSATLPVEMLRMAEAANRARTERHTSIRSISIDPQHMPVTTPSGFSLAATHTLTEAPPCDMVILPALWRNPRPALRTYRDDVPWLQSQSEQGAILIAVGTGACFMVEAVLLKNQAATTHWHYFDRFQRDYPDVKLKRNYFITRSGNIYCAASVNALAQLMVHLIYRRYGRETANLVERNFFHEVRNVFDLKDYFDEQAEYHPDEEIVQAQIWLDDNYAQPVKIADLAAQFGFSVRNFDRRFKQALGSTPVQYLQKCRIRNACELLKQSNLTVAEVAEHCGYQNASAFARQFRQQLNASPKKYRETVRAKLFSRVARNT